MHYNVRCFRQLFFPAQKMIFPPFSIPSTYYHKPGISGPDILHIYSQWWHGMFQRILCEINASSVIILHIILRKSWKYILAVIRVFNFCDFHLTTCRLQITLFHVTDFLLISAGDSIIASWGSGQNHYSCANICFC